MKENRGQALVEFIIIIPVLVLVISALIDFGNIIYQKYQLEGELDLVTDMYQNNELDKMNTYVSDINASIKIEKDNQFITVILTKDVNINTIILNNVIGQKYPISVKKSIYAKE